LTIQFVLYVDCRVHACSIAANGLCVELTYILKVVTLTVCVSSLIVDLCACCDRTVDVMVNKCCAFGCKSGYKGHSVTAGIRLTFHSFPRDKDLCVKWVRAISRKDFTPSKYSRVCSLHFRDTDFIEAHDDSNSTRNKKYANAQLECRYLRKDAVPSIFPNAPSYMSSHAADTTRGSASAATASGRREHEAQRLENLAEIFEAEDNLQSLSPEQIRDKLSTEAALPSGFQTIVVDGMLVIYRLNLVDCLLEMQASIAVRSDLTVAVYVESKEIPAAHYNDLLPGSLQYLSQLVNVMARVKAWCENCHCRPTSLKLDIAMQCLQDYLETVDFSSVEHRQVNFILEQLRLSTKNKYGRHYSPQLTVLAYLINASSTAAYKVLLDQQILCLPSTTTLEKVTRHVNSNSGLDNTSYLKLRVSKLNACETNVLLIMDEIYVAKRVEYSAGEVQGLTSDGAVASTLLAFMVKSLVCKYKDIVALYPMAKLTADKQNDCYKEVMALLHTIGLNVVALSVDNASTNRKFYIDHLCGGSLQTSVTDAQTNQPLFLIFDPVHDLKNLYNNFQSRKTFHCPPFEANLPNGCHADFNHIVQLFNHEASFALKKAHKLSPSVLNPSSIEKTSVALATSVFCESTRDALVYYAVHENKPEWKETADFITLVLKLWNVMNVKHSSKGKQKRDITMDPVRSSMDWKLHFLREFAEFLQRWEANSRDGLTRETFLALRQTCCALADCAAYLLDRCGFNFVLLGRLQSDALESRFGWLRQLSGANYYISMRQVMEGDRKIRALSLLKFSKVSLSELESAVQSDSTSSSSNSETDTAADAIAAALTFNVQPSISDAHIIFYVSGAISRSVVATTKCDACRDVLICPMLLPALEVDNHMNLDVSSSEFLDSINRGGLIKPTEFVYQLTTHCWRVFEEIRHTAELKRLFLQGHGRRNLFCKIMDRATYNEEYLHLLFGMNMCTMGHDLLYHVVRRFYNCLAKNFVKQLTNEVGQQSGPPAKKRKIAKLSSTNH
jgi:hypothetical protein